MQVTFRIFSPHLGKFWLNKQGNNSYTSIPLLIKITYSVNRTDLVKPLMISNYAFWSSVLSIFHLTLKHIGTYVPYGKYFGRGTSYKRWSFKECMFCSLGLRHPKIEHRLSSTNLHTMPSLLFSGDFLFWTT